MGTKSIEDYSELLTDSKSAKRRSAARALGKTGDSRHGAMLLAALQAELRDKRTWETQCAMIKALGDVGYRPAIPVLWRLSEEKHAATILYHESGFALCRLEPITNNDLTVVKSIIATQNPAFIRGAFMAVYYLRIIPAAHDDVRQILETAGQDTENEGRIITQRCYIAAACAKWNFPEVADFLASCRQSPWKFLQDIAASSQAGEYPNWQPW